MDNSPAILWLRRDLRLTDNPALTRAARHSRLIILYIDEAPEDDWSPGAASRWWLDHSLRDLEGHLESLGSRLSIRRGDPLEILIRLVRDTGATHIYWNALPEPASSRRDRAIADRLEAQGLRVGTFNTALLFGPGAITKPDGNAYRVFTPFWKACLRQGLPDRPLPAPTALPPSPENEGLTVDALGLRPEIPWDTGLHHRWSPGCTSALSRLETFADEGVRSYERLRDRPDLDATSRLSPHLHFGEISPRQLVAAIQSRSSGDATSESGSDALLRQLGWREFAHHLLAHFPDTPTQPLDTRFAAFPWQKGYEGDLRLWQRGLTGIPLVDAGMRELWHSGWMHNRVRMVAASFLTKNLLIPWQEGARWFWDTLVDADLANNTLGWQWVAGCGADAAPYFRIFNPVLQGEKFDPAGLYVRRWIPELAELPDRHVHHPWTAPAPLQAKIRAAGYPAPMVDLSASRERALTAYHRFRG